MSADSPSSPSSPVASSGPIDALQNAVLNPAVTRTLMIAGRALLGLYFIVPGITKITGFAGMSVYMQNHGVPLVPVLLVLTIVLQIGGGLCLLAGYRQQLIALMLAGLTLVISLFMHDFWNVTEAVQAGHETQNFVKNMAIMAGLLFVAGTQPTRKVDV